MAVYDLGGGTFDISILEMAEGLFQVRATGGDTFLGGEDFDQRVIDWLIAEFLRETGIDLRQDRMALQRLKEAAEKAKCELSTAQQTEIVLPFISADASGPKHLNTVLTPPEVRGSSPTTSSSARSSPAGAAWPTPAARRADRRGAAGGRPDPGPQGRPRSCARSSARSPTARSTPTRASRWARPSRPASSQGEVKDLVLLDVTPHTLGIETKDGTFTPLIERNSTIPTRKSRVFTTVADNQTRVEVHVLQGESDMAAYNKSLAKFELTNIPPAPKGVPQIEVTFEIDVNGIVVGVGARTRPPAAASRWSSTPRAASASRRSTAWSPRRAPASQAERAKKDQEAVVRQLDGLVANTMRSVQALEGKLTSEEQDRILEAMENAKKARAEGDLDELKERLADMEKAASLIGQAMLRP